MLLNQLRLDLKVRNRREKTHLPITSFSIMLNFYYITKYQKLFSFIIMSMLFSVPSKQLQVPMNLLSSHTPLQNLLFTTQQERVLI